MEIESFWKGLKPFKPTERGQEGIGYGCRSKNYNKYDKCEKRKAYREIKKYGFDLSEIWSLDYTIMRWLSDNVGGFFRICGSSAEWGQTDLEGNPYDFYEHRKDDDWSKKTQLYDMTRYNSYQKHLKDFLTTCDIETFDDFRDFVIPRLRKLADIEHGWPGGDDFPTYEDWIKSLNKMADDFESGERCPKYFIEYFWNLWD